MANIHIALVLTVFLGIVQAQNLFKNPNFEEPFSRENWYGNGATLAQVTDDAYEGTYSGKISDRYTSFHCPFIVSILFHNTSLIFVYLIVA